MSTMTVHLNRRALLTASAAAAILGTGTRSAFSPPTGKAPSSNPIFRDVFTADPAALVYNDRLYVYVGHDNAKEGQFFTMPGWRLYSSDDAKTWTSHGYIMRPENFAYGRTDVAWASQMVEKDGKFYFYVTLRLRDSQAHAIAVAVGHRPEGPFRDARGTPLITDDMTTDSRRTNADIDPTVYVDADGTPWMAWGNGDCYLARLKRNMIELDGPIQKLDLVNYAEGPWLFRRGDLYYNVYAGEFNGISPEHIGYSTAPAMRGPWTYRGLVTGPAKVGFTIHPAVIEFKGQWYFFYHDGSVSLNGIPGGDVRRSGGLQPFAFNPDGSIPFIIQT